jgi:hypothetical protein
MRRSGGFEVSGGSRADGLRARGIGAALALACAGMLLACTPAAMAAFPGANGRIAFQSYRDQATDAQI